MEIKERAEENKICPLEIAVNSISGKWKIPIVWQINEGKKRPSEFLRGIAKVDRRVLNQQLKEMEQDGILTKEAFLVSINNFPQSFNSHKASTSFCPISVREYSTLGGSSLKAS